MTYLFKNITTEEELDRALTFEKRVFKDSKHHSLTAYSKDSWLERLQRYSELMLFAEADGEVVGLVFARIEEDGSATVGPVATDPRCRNQGLARTLMMLIEVRAQARGIRTLTLGAVAEAEGFYLKCGYTPYLFVQAKTPLTLAELRGLNQAYKEVWSY
jgi:ribosomal protein S18 acetylase RimI-like enzyme